jgi:hypothetical protein
MVYYLMRVLGYGQRDIVYLPLQNSIDKSIVFLLVTVFLAKRERYRYLVIVVCSQRALDAGSYCV